MYINIRRNQKPDFEYFESVVLNLENYKDIKFTVQI